MTLLPLRSLFVSDFRRLDGHRTFPLDAPVVLVHGPNGSGKTSILSALELALTGDIRSMRRQDPRFTAHLPFHGQEFATVRVDVAEPLAANSEPVTMTAGGSRVEGGPALGQEAAQFYAERCYLDQVSLGRLLELYQHREGKEEAALARFVNELLGLEQLDALRQGLSDATDLRRLRKLCEPLADAEAAIKSAEGELSRATKELDGARQSMTRTRTALVAALEELELLPQGEADEQDLVHRATELLRPGLETNESDMAALRQSLTTLGGRIDALTRRPSSRRLEEARVEAEAASAEFEDWSETHGVTVEGWRSDAAKLGLDATGALAQSLDDERHRIERDLARQAEAVTTADRLEQQVRDDKAHLETAEGQLAGAQEQVGSLAEGLAALREHASANLCPVCDRDFAEVSSTHLTTHVDLKIAELTTQGSQLRQLRQERDAIAERLQRNERALSETQTEVWSDDERQGVLSRRAALSTLRTRLDELQPVIAKGRDLRRRRDELRSEVEEFEAGARDLELAKAELQELARGFDVPQPDEAASLKTAWQRLVDLTSIQAKRQAAHRRAADLLDEVSEATRRVTAAKDAVAEAAERKVRWEDKVKEARRRQGVAKAVLDASSSARAAIVQRVFTESLNEVWRSVFTRLAPREPFIPAFGIPGSSKTALELKLETIHSSGESGGPPEMMLSAGNLNTAALSLFISLHLAVDPLVPCLVFDDPVQSMDEVHVAQFAGLIRVLSKHHDRQVIIAVHERELFQYLALELSPAFAGDELITIELGARSHDEDRGVVRHTWSGDSALVV